jgi:hypothetical protein
MNNVSHDDIERLFREQDNIGPDSSLWLRPLHQLIKDGKPVGQVIAITISMSEKQRFPLGILAQTKSNRTIFWPILPKKAKIMCDEEIKDVFDHITLELPSENIHVTTYDTNAKASHLRRAWRMYHFSNSTLALWFMMLVRIPILRQQDKAVQRRIKMPTSDRNRRVQEFSRYINNFSFNNVNMPDCNEQQDCICCIPYLAPESFTIDQFSSSVIPFGLLASVLEGWSELNQLYTNISLLKLGQQTICLAIFCPPGRLYPNSDVFIGFPQSAGLQH